MSARERDEHGRPQYAAHEVPPIAVGLAVWQGNVTAAFPPYPGNQVAGCHPTDPARKPYATCTHGWVRSGDWWLHCADCHPAPEPRCEQHPTYPEPCAVCAMNRVPS